jgi:hypothetical protein
MAEFRRIRQNGGEDVSRSHLDITDPYFLLGIEA